MWTARLVIPDVMETHHYVAHQKDDVHGRHWCSCGSVLQARHSTRSDDHLQLLLCLGDVSHSAHSA